MIEKINTNQFALSCDICCETIDAHNEHRQRHFDSFHKAVDYKKDNGWKSKKIDGEWQDICPECQKEN